MRAQVDLALSDTFTLSQTGKSELHVTGWRQTSVVEDDEDDEDDDDDAAEEARTPSHAAPPQAHCHRHKVRARIDVEPTTLLLPL